MAAKILRDHFSLFVHFEETVRGRGRGGRRRGVQPDQGAARAERRRARAVRARRQLPARGADPDDRRSGAEDRAEMLKYRNFGKKSLKEIQDLILAMGLHFGMDVSALPRARPSRGPRARTKRTRCDQDHIGLRGRGGGSVAPGRSVRVQGGRIMRHHRDHRAALAARRSTAAPCCATSSRRSSSTSGSRRRSPRRRKPAGSPSA